jgi:putative ABC transport system permease protein
MRRRPGLLRMMWADLWLERRLALCTVLGMAAVLAPLVVLAGLRAGVVEGVREALLQDPHAREILSGGNREYAAAELDRLRGRHDVGFLVPRLRWTIPDVVMWAADRADDEPVYLRLIASGRGDPLLQPGEEPASFNAVVLSAAAAAKLNVGRGAELLTRIDRSSRELGRETVELHLTVQAVAAPAAEASPAAFVTLGFATFKEDFQDFVAAAPPLGSTPPARARASYAGFRLYARRLDDVPELDADLNRLGFDVNSQAASKVASLLAIDHGLGLLLMLVAALGGSGYLLALGATLWASVERKRSAFAVLRFLGMRTAALTALPVLQSIALAIFGAGLAVAAAAAAAAVINHLFAGSLGLDRPLCRITAMTAFGAVALTIAGSVLAAAAAGARLSRIEPWEGIISQS